MKQNTDKISNFKEHAIQQTSFFFHSYFNRDIDNIIPLIDENFIFMGSYDFYYTKGIEGFLEIAKKYQNEVPAQVYNEEYHLLSRIHNIWIIYGRFCVSLWKNKKTFLYSRIKTTLVWKSTENGFKLLHMHAAMARDVPLEGEVDIETKQKLEVRLHNYILHTESNKNNTQEQILIKDIDGGIHYLFPGEILYVSLTYHIATIYTSTEKFCTRKPTKQLLEIMPFLVQAHKSWLVNPLYVVKI